MKLTARQFKWLPNALTLMRMSLAAVVCWLAAHERWAPSFWLLVIALSTDFLDGLAAKKLHAMTAAGMQLDRLADLLIAGGAFIGLAIAGHLSWWVILFAPLLGIFLAEERFFRPKTGWLHYRRPVLSIINLFAAWIFAVLSYASLAYGWHWWYLVLTVAILATSASLKRHRLRAWFKIPEPVKK